MSTKRLLKTKNAKPRTNWKRYLPCETCGAGDGKPCIDLHVLNAPGNYTQYTLNPHPHRRLFSF